MDELRHRAQGLLDHPPVEPRPLQDLRAHADRMRRTRRRRQRLAAVAVVLVLAATAAGLVEATRSTTPTVRAVVPVNPSTSPGPTSTAPATTVAGPAASAHLPPVIAFSGPQDGWMASGAACGDGHCGDPILRHTTDGGRTWTLVSTVPAVHQAAFSAQVLYAAGSLVVLHFADATDGWYGQGGRLWSTHDGGRTWHELAVSSITAVTSTGGTAWAWGMSGSCADVSTPASVGTTAACPIHLLSTPSAIDDWNPVPGSPSAAVGGDLVADGTTLWTLDGGQVYVAMAGSVATLRAAPYAGEAGLGPLRLLDLGPGDVGVLSAAGAVDGATNTMAKTIVHSTDQGIAWRRWATAPATGWAGWVAGNGSGTALVVTDGHTLWRSTGAAWTDVFTPTAPTGEIDDLTMASPSTGFLVADDGGPGVTVWSTRDAGRTWSPVPLS